MAAGRGEPVDAAGGWEALPVGATGGGFEGEGWLSVSFRILALWAAARAVSLSRREGPLCLLHACG